MCPFDAMASAVSTFVGQNYGAGRLDRIKKGIRYGATTGASYGVAMGIVLAVFGRYLSMAFITGNSAQNSQILDASAQLLLVAGIFFWLLGILNVVRLAVQALGYSHLSITSYFFVPIYGFSAICFSDQSAWITATTYSTLICIHVIKLIEKKLNNRKAAVPEAD